jgi:hypothetical protein
MQLPKIKDGNIKYNIYQPHSTVFLVSLIWLYIPRHAECYCSVSRWLCYIFDKNEKKNNTLPYVIGSQTISCLLQQQQQQIVEFNITKRRKIVGTHEVLSYVRYCASHFVTAGSELFNTSDLLSDINCV